MFDTQVPSTAASRTEILKSLIFGTENSSYRSRDIYAFSTERFIADMISNNLIQMYFSCYEAAERCDRPQRTKKVTKPLQISSSTENTPGREEWEEGRREKEREERGVGRRESESTHSKRTSRKAINIA